MEGRQRQRRGDWNATVSLIEQLDEAGLEAIEETEKARDLLEKMCEKRRDSLERKIEREGREKEMSREKYRQVWWVLIVVETDGFGVCGF